MQFSSADFAISLLQSSFGLAWNISSKARTKAISWLSWQDDRRSYEYTLRLFSLKLLFIPHSSIHMLPALWSLESIVHLSWQGKWASSTFRINSASLQHHRPFSTLQNRPGHLLDTQPAELRVHCCSTDGFSQFRHQRSTFTSSSNSTVCRFQGD